MHDPLGNIHFIHKRVLGFRWQGECLIATPREPFKPRGLMLWNLPDDTMVSACHCGNHREVLASQDPVPAMFFATALSFEQVEALLKMNKEPATWCTFSPLQQGTYVKLYLTRDGILLTEDSKIRAAMWGQQLTY